MKNFKILIFTVMLCSFLLLGQPAIARANAAETQSLVPAIVLVQDKNDGMLVNHSFNMDSKIYIPMDKGIDTGFYITIPKTE